MKHIVQTPLINFHMNLSTFTSNLILVIFVTKGTPWHINLKGEGVAEALRWKESGAVMGLSFSGAIDCGWTFLQGEGLKVWSHMDLLQFEEKTSKILLSFHIFGSLYVFPYFFLREVLILFSKMDN